MNIELLRKEKIPLRALTMYQTADIKLDNVLANYGDGNIRSSDDKLGDCGSTVHVGSIPCEGGLSYRSAYISEP